MMIKACIYSNNSIEEVFAKYVFNSLTILNVSHRMIPFKEAKDWFLGYYVLNMSLKKATELFFFLQKKIIVFTEEF